MKSFTCSSLSWKHGSSQIYCLLSVGNTFSLLSLFSLFHISIVNLGFKNMTFIKKKNHSTITGKDAKKPTELWWKKEMRSLNTPEPGFLLWPPGLHHRWPHKLWRQWSLHTFSAPGRTNLISKHENEPPEFYAERIWCPNFITSEDFKSHLNKLVEGGICGVVGNEEPHVLVGDLHRGRSIHSSHGDNVWKIITNPKFPTD